MQNIIQTEDGFMDFINFNLGTDGPFGFDFSGDELLWATYLTFGDSPQTFETLCFDRAAVAQVLSTALEERRFDAGLEIYRFKYRLAEKQNDQKVAA